jgi:ring-1,2-phenylacetyl-CoA epoxidase subunit PaaB
MTQPIPAADLPADSPQPDSYEVFRATADGLMTHCGTVQAAQPAAARRAARKQFGPATAELWLVPAAAISQVRSDDGLESAYALETPPEAEPPVIVQEARAYQRGEQDYAVFRQPAPDALRRHLGMVRAASAPEALQQAEAVFGPAAGHGSYWLLPWAAVLVVESGAEA